MPQSPANFDDLQDDNQSTLSTSANQTASNPTTLNFDDLIPDNQNIMVKPQNFDDLQDDSQKYGGVGQQLLTGAEGLAQGVAGPLATYVETHLPAESGLQNLVGSSQDIVNRAATNPIAHALGETSGVAGSLISGLGEAGLANTALEKLLPSAIPETGANILKGMISSGLIQGGDEISKSLLGQNPSPIDAIGATLASSALGAITGGAFSGSQKVLSAAGESKLGTYINSLLSGIGDAAQGATGNLPEEGQQAYKAGVNFYNNAINSAAHTAASGTLVPLGYEQFGIPGAIIAEKIAKPVANMLKIPISAVGSYVTPAITKILSSNPAGDNLAGKLYGALNYANAADSGIQAINKGIGNLFQAGGQQLVNTVDTENEKNKKSLDQYIKNGGIQQNINQSVQNLNNAQPQVPKFAQGGEVQEPEIQPTTSEDGILNQSDALATHFPEHNMALTEVRSRISNYLTSMQPQQNQPKLAFDESPDNQEQHKSYDKALNIAINPLSVLDHVNNGTLQAEHVKYMNDMHPEFSNLLQKKLTEKIIQSQLNGEKPNYNVRQGLSLLMGTALTGELIPQNIQAAQATFQQQSSNQPQLNAPQSGRNKKNTSTLGKVSNQYLTPNQARTEDQQKQ